MSPPTADTLNEEEGGSLSPQFSPGLPQTAGGEGRLGSPPLPSSVVPSQSTQAALPIRVPPASPPPPALLSSTGRGQKTGGVSQSLDITLLGAGSTVAADNRPEELGTVSRDLGCLIDAYSATK